MIVNIRGTNGAGKSELVRRALLDRLSGARGVSVHRALQRKPVATNYDNGVTLMGHYEIANGGMDTMRCTIEEAWDLVEEFAAGGRHVLCEGKNQSRDWPHVLRAAGKYPLTVLHLTTPPRECVSGVRIRGHSLSQDSIMRTWKKCERDVARLEKLGVKVIRCDREQAVEETRRLLCLT